MSFRFRKSVKILPGVRLNVSKSGVSTTIGKKGASVNLGGKRGPRGTVGLPGTGLSYSAKLGAQRADARPRQAAQGITLTSKVVILVVVILGIILISGSFS